MNQPDNRYYVIHTNPHTKQRNIHSFQKEDLAKEFAQMVGGQLMEDPNQQIERSIKWNAKNSKSL